MNKLKKLNVFNHESMKEFLRDISVALTVFSFFLFLFIEIIRTDLFDQTKMEFSLVLGLLITIAFILGCHILAIANTYKDTLIQFFGFVVFLLPVILITLLTSSLKHAVDDGFAIIGGVISIGMSIFAVFLFFKWFEKKYAKCQCLYIVSFCISALSFLVFKLLSNHILFSESIKIWYLLDSILLGLEIGFWFAIIAAPLVIFVNHLDIEGRVNKMFDKAKIKNN